MRITQGHYEGSGFLAVSRELGSLSQLTMLTGIDHSGDLGSDHAQSEPLLQQNGLLARVCQIDLDLSIFRAPGIQ